MRNIIAGAAIAISALAFQTLSAQENQMVVIKTSAGDITVELYADKAPISVENFLTYAKEGFYEGTIFHRVIDGFMIQCGGMTEDMSQKKNRAPIKNEAGNGLQNKKYTLAMARTSVPDSATSQFFINVADNGFLDRAQSQDGVGYAVFGKVTAGMDVVDKIAKVKTANKKGHGDVPVETITIDKVEIVEAK